MTAADGTSVHLKRFYDYVKLAKSATRNNKQRWTEYQKLMRYCTQLLPVIVQAQLRNGNYTASDVADHFKAVQQKLPTEGWQRGTVRYKVNDTVNWRTWFDRLQKGEYI